jgi:cyclopropane fatty-acyl-phospholipid synthase-like methyltransferase
VKPANNPGEDYRALIARGYDVCADAFNAARSREADDVLRPLFDVVPAGARVLDFGCGAGVPITRSLSARYDVLGVDISAGQLALACRQAPAASFALADMANASFAPAAFDAVVSMYAIFHVPREEHAGLFLRMHEWLRPGGWLLASLAHRPEAAYTEDFFGVEMYWSNFGMEEYRAILAAARFVVVSETGLSHGYDAADRPVESHPLILAQRS